MDKRKFKSITVGKLRDLLAEYDDKDMIAFSCDYGDYHHTEQVLPITGRIEEEGLVESGYSHSGFAVYDGDKDDEDDDHTELPVVLVLK